MTADALNSLDTPSEWLLNRVLTDTSQIIADQRAEIEALKKELKSRKKGTSNMDCAICGNKIQPTSYGWDEGNNAEPVVMDGRCCDVCDMTVVLPARLERAGFEGTEAKAIGQEFGRTIGKLLGSVINLEGSK